MNKYEAGKWPSYNVKAIVNNVNLVFKSRDIRKLNGTAYKFITLHMGFIAHYGLRGFQDSYQDLEQFAKALQTSEYSGSNYEYTTQQAARQETDGDFRAWYGDAYNKSIANTIRGIVEVARKYYPGRGTADMFEGAGNFYATKEPIAVSKSKTTRSGRKGTRSIDGLGGMR